MALYLQMDGVDDYIQTPSFQWDEVIMDFSASQLSNFQKYIATSNSGYIQVASRPTDNWDTNTFSSVYVNGNSVTINTDFVPYDARLTMRGVRVNNTAYISYIFRNSSASGFMKGNIYSVTFKLAGNVVALYDMTTGTVQDQSGNGRHATLTGGTWLDDGAGGTPITINAVTASSSADTITPVVTTQQQVSVSSIIADTIADALSPNVGSFTNISVSAIIVNATADALSPSVEAVLNIGIEAPVADVTAETMAPFVGSSESIQITAVIASLTADVNAPSVYTSQGIQIDSVIAELTADVISPTIQTDAIITAIISELQAAGIADTIRVIIGDLEQYNEVIRLVLNITRSRTATLDITQHKQSELNL